MMTRLNFRGQTEEQRQPRLSCGWFFPFHSLFKMEPDRLPQSSTVGQAGSRHLQNSYSRGPSVAARGGRCWKYAFTSQTSTSTVLRFFSARFFSACEIAPSSRFSLLQVGQETFASELQTLTMLLCKQCRRVLEPDDVLGLCPTNASVEHSHRFIYCIVLTQARVS